jgi:transposase
MEAAQEGQWVSYNFHPIIRDQYLCPPDMREWLPKDHFAYFLIDAMQQLDLSKFLAKYRADGVGATAFHPQILLGVILYGYSQGVRSSRQIERHCQEDVAYRIVAANQQPDHCTISRCITRHSAELSELFLQVLKLCHAMGLVKVGVIALDGTKLNASAALDGNRTRSKLEEEIAAMLAEGRAIDQREDTLYGADRRGDELPENCRDDGGRGARMKQALEVITQKEQALAERKYAPPKQKEISANVTDPDSRVMKTRQGFVQGYNAQLAVTEEQIVIAADVTQQENDKLQLQPMVQQARTNVAALARAMLIGTVLTDAGYYREANGRWAEENYVDWLTATSKRHKIDAEPRKKLSECLNYKDLMERRIRTDSGRALYKKRGKTVEPVIGQIKEVHNARRCGRRGIEAVRSEWRLTCTVHNLRKLYNAKKSKGT